LNIVVPVKSVIDVELNIRVRDGKIVEDGLNYILSKWDENALEAALQLKEANGGEVTAVTIGPERAGEALRKALAMGADKGVHVNDPAAQGSDAAGIARILAKVIQRGPFDLVMFNPPYLPTEDGLSPDRRETGGPEGDELSMRFVKELPRVLTPGGRAYLVTSSLQPEGRLAAMAADRFGVEVAGATKHFFEEISVLTLALRPGATRD